MKQKYTIIDENGTHELELTEDEFHARIGTAPFARRQLAYEDLGYQLNLLYDDINSGVFGEKAKTGEFYSYLKSIKTRFPKTI
jgi:hypothetical protein